MFRQAKPNSVLQPRVFQSREQSANDEDERGTESYEDDRGYEGTITKGAYTSGRDTKNHGRHEHRIVAEQMLGRPLRKGEVVHHINRDKQDNRPENLMVFPSQAAHAKWHKENDEKGGDAE